MRRIQKSEVSRQKSEKSGIILPNRYVACVLSIFLMFGLLVACMNKDKIPSDVLQRDEMEKVMWDMIQADRFSSQFMERDSNLQKNIKIENLKQYERVFQIHKITKEEFVRSFKFYLSHPEINQVLFDTMAARANRRRNDVYTGNSDTAK
jgi:hypothetical protein